MTKPRIYVSGFSVFPGAPVNPTENLVRCLNETSHEFSNFCELRVELLAVDYRMIADRLAAAARRFEPDIAIHFGLSESARGFRIERYARNYADPDCPDNAGYLPNPEIMVAGPPLFRTTLPVERLEADLARAGIRVSQDDCAGEYLCNTLFYLSRSGTCGRFRPVMSGFIHVPQQPVSEGGLPGEGARMPLAEMVAGATRIIQTCAAQWVIEQSNASTVAQTAMRA